MEKKVKKKVKKRKRTTFVPFWRDGKLWGRPSNKMNKRKLGLGKIRTIVEKLMRVAKEHNADFCLIGGALFSYMRIAGYQTPDIDVAAIKDLGDNALPLIDNPNSFSWNQNGHYDVDGVKVDWINKLSDGTIELFRRAVKRRVYIGGIPCAQLEDAMAIRLAAGRNKDKAHFRKWAKKKIIDGHRVAALVLRLAPLSPGAAWILEQKKNGRWPDEK